MEEETIDKEVLDALHMLLNCSLKDKEFETQKEQFHIVYDYIKKLEEKVMYALGPTNHEFALETKRNFKKIIKKNIDEDTYTIKRELKKYWNNMDTYWLGDD